MKKLYIVFDQLPDIEAGGLLATYISLSNLLKDTYDIEIISIFNFNDENKQSFPNNKINVINKKNIDNRFYKVFSHIKKLEFKKALHSISSLFIYFFSIKKNKKKVRQLISDEDLVIVSCPSAGIFMPKSVEFILEIHIDYRYFFGNNKLGSMQAKLMTKPTLTLFRTKNDATNAPKYLNPNYIYNFFDNTNSVVKKHNNNKIIFVGRIEDQKDPLRLIDMAYELKKINNDFILDMYGTGSLESKCQEKIKQLKLENNVFMKGFIDDKNIYANYSLLWLTSKMEGFGLVIIEAKACGVPTISTNWGNSINEVIKDNEDGYIINDNVIFAKKTNEILANKKLQKELSTNALKNFEKFSKEKAKANWINYLNNYKTK